MSTTTLGRPLRRWMNDYNRYGFDALKPGFRSDRGKSRNMTPQLEQAILDKIEAFPRIKGSVIYDQLVKEGKLAPADCKPALLNTY